MKIIRSSSEGTPQDEILFVVEYPATTRVKMRLVDVERELESIEKDSELKEERKIELKEIEKEMKKQL